MGSLSMREINANFKRFISIFKKENDPDYRANLDEDISEFHSGAKSVDVILDSNGLIIAPPNDFVPYNKITLTFEVHTPEEDSERTDTFRLPNHAKVKLVHIPEENGKPESIEVDKSLSGKFGGRAQYAALFDAIYRFNKIAHWKSLPEEKREEVIEQYKRKKPFLRQQYPDRIISIV